MRTFIYCHNSSSVLLCANFSTKSLTSAQKAEKKRTEGRVVAF